AIGFDAIADRTWGDADFGVSPVASSGLPVSLSLGAAGNCTPSGASVHVTGAGSCSLIASQAGDSNYKPADDVTRTFAIRKANQSIAFDLIPDHTWGDGDFPVAPSAGSGLPVSLAT